MQLFETTGDLARGLALLTEGWHPLILHPPPLVVEIIPLLGETDPWSYRDQSSEPGDALAFLDGLRQTLGVDALLVWQLERLMEDYRFSPAQYWQFRAEFLLEFWQAEAHAIEDLLEGRTVAPGRRPFVLVSLSRVWSCGAGRPVRPRIFARTRSRPAKTNGICLHRSERNSENK
jgi:hypothetical protein